MFKNQKSRHPQSTAVSTILASLMTVNGCFAHTSVRCNGDLEPKVIPGRRAIKPVEYTALFVEPTSTTQLFPPIAVPQHTQWHPSDKWALVVGISDFESGAADVPFSAGNAKEFADLLVEKENFKPDHIWLLRDQEATTSAIRRALCAKWLPAVARPNDLAVVYISTHGTEPGQDLGGESKIYGYDSQADDDYTTAITVREIWERIASAYKVQHIAFFVDACNSGGQLCALADQAKQQTTLGSSPSPQKPPSIVMFAACGNDQQSNPLPSKQSSAFSFHLINRLRQHPEQDLVSICRDVSNAVENDVRAQLQKPQTPKVSSTDGSVWMVVSDAAKPEDSVDPPNNLLKQYPNYFLSEQIKMASKISSLPNVTVSRTSDNSELFRISDNPSLTGAQVSPSRTHARIYHSAPHAYSGYHRHLQSKKALALAHSDSSDSSLRNYWFGTHAHHISSSTSNIVDSVNDRSMTPLIDTFSSNTNVGSNSNSVLDSHSLNSIGSDTSSNGDSDVYSNANLDDQSQTQSSVDPDKRENRAIITRLTSQAAQQLKNGNLAAAEDLYQRALIEANRQMGPQSLTAAQCKRRLGEILCSRGAYLSGNKILEEALPVMSWYRGASSLEVAAIHGSLARSLVGLGRYSDADTELRQCLTLRKDQLPTNTRIMALTMDALGDLYTRTGKYQPAADSFSRAAHSWSKMKGGINDNDYKLCLINWGDTLAALGRIKEARQKYELAIVQAPTDQISQTKALARSYDVKGQYSKSEPLYEKLVAYESDISGSDPRHFIESLNDLARCYLAQHNTTKAEPIYKKALSINQSLAYPQSRDLAYSMIGLAGIDQMKGNFSSSVKSYQEALGLTQQVFGSSHKETNEIRHHLAVIQSHTQQLNFRKQTGTGSDKAASAKL